MEAVSRAGQRPGRFHGSAGCSEESILILRDTGPRGGLAGVRSLKLPFCGHCVRWILEITCSTGGLGEVIGSIPVLRRPRTYGFLTTET